MASESPWVVLKFGGTSVSSRARWTTIARVITERKRQGYRPFVVCSAVSGITDALEDLIDKALTGAHEPALDAIKQRHRALGEELDVDAAAILTDAFQELDRLAQGIALIGEVSPRLRARVMAYGELMSTRLGAAFLADQDFDVRWRDARTMLRATPEATASDQRAYLAASCSVDPDAHLQRDLADPPADVYLTQGFIARNEADETVLIGRGGSDTSAAYFAVMLEADRLEIWTDVPGLFSADPRHVPDAHLLRSLGYAEAQELATMGAKVLHPRCIDPVRKHDIPLHIRSTEAPEMEGTVISRSAPDSPAHLKAISAKPGVLLVSMSTLGMWQRVGFLADVFAVFKRHGLSIDLIATSEANVTVSIDSLTNTLTPAVIEAVERDLEPYCTVEMIRPCAAVSLIGRHIRSLLPDLSPAFSVLDELSVHLMTQAASDLNLTVVVDEDQAEALVRALHERLFEQQTPAPQLGPTWQELFGPVETR